MSIEVINTGTSPNSGNGDTLRSAFIKVNNNFSYLQSSLTNISIVQGPTGPQGEIGPTGPQGIGIVENGQEGNAAYYSTNGVVLSSTNILNFDVNNNLLIIGNNNDISTTRIVHIVDQYTQNVNRLYNKFTFVECHESRDSNNLVFYRTRGNHNNPASVIEGDDIADISFNTINNASEMTGVANISVTILNTSSAHPTGAFRFQLGKGLQTFPEEVLRITNSSTLNVNILDSLTTGTSLQVINNLVPATDSTYNLGSTSSQWNNLFLNNSLQFSDNTTQTTAYNLLDTIPESSTSTGIKGQMAVSTTSLYVCVATNSWLKFDGTTF